MSDETDVKAANAATPLPATANPENLYWVMSENRFMYLPTRTLFERAAVMRQVGEKVALLIEREKVCSNLFWAPGMPTLIENKACIDGALFDEPGNNLLNTYKPPPRVEGDPAKADFWRSLGRFVLPEGDFERLEQKLAFKLQHPERKINHCVVMGSKDQGIGKDSLLAPIELGVGVNNFNSVTAGVALEWSHKGFTAPLLQRLIVRVSEVHDLGRDRFAFYNMIKDWCAAPPTYIMVANKNVKPSSILNVVLPFFSTNYLIDGFHIEPGDRRTDLMWSPRTPADFQDEKHRHAWDDYDYKITRDDTKKDEFWQGYYKHVELNWHHVVAYLMQPALIESFSPGATPFHTPAWHRVVNAGADNQDIELKDVLEAIGATMEPWDIDNGVPDAVIIPQITRHPACPDKLQSFFWNEAPRSVLRRMERAGYLSVESPNRTDGRWRIAGQLYTIYVRREFNRQKALNAARELIESEEIWQMASRNKRMAASEELQ